MSSRELSKAFEFIKDRLYYVALRSAPRDSDRAHFFCIDNELVYWNFFLDFGPLNLGQLYRFCQKLSNKLRSRKYANRRIYFYSSTHPHKRTNAAFLISAYAMLCLGRSPEEAYAPFRGVYPPFPPFHDASPCVCTYNLTILDCLRGIDKARRFKFFDFERFDVEEYEYFEQVDNGDLSWIVDGKFCAFAGPHNSAEESTEGYSTLTPEHYVEYFKRRNVELVVRLNKKYYDETRFTRHGIGHVELYYLDGSTPSDDILQHFLSVCEATSGSIAVHCKAGLGRTGTTIACYIMKHYRLSAAEVIGWIRVCRPGSIIGPQQHYLKQVEARMWREGDAFRAQRGFSRPIVAPHLPGSPGATAAAAEAEAAAAAAEAKAKAKSPTASPDAGGRTPPSSGHPRGGTGSGGDVVASPLARKAAAAAATGGSGAVEQLARGVGSLSLSAAGARAVSSEVRYASELGLRGGAAEYAAGASGAGSASATTPTGGTSSSRASHTHGSSGSKSTRRSAAAPRRALAAAATAAPTSPLFEAGSTATRVGRSTPTSASRDGSQGDYLLRARRSPGSPGSRRLTPSGTGAAATSGSYRYR